MNTKFKIGDTVKVYNIEGSRKVEAVSYSEEYNSVLYQVEGVKVPVAEMYVSLEGE